MAEAKKFSGLAGLHPKASDDASFPYGFAGHVVMCIQMVRCTVALMRISSAPNATKQPLTFT